MRNKKLPKACAEQTFYHRQRLVRQLESSDVEILNDIWACRGQSCSAEWFEARETRRLFILADMGIVKLIGKKKTRIGDDAFTDVELTVYGRKCYAFSDGIDCFVEAAGDAAIQFAENLWVNIGQGEGDLINKQKLEQAIVDLLRDNTVNLLAKGIK